MSQGVVSQLESELSIEEKDDLTPEEIAGLSAEAFIPREFDAKEAEAVGYSNYSYWRCTFQAFWKNKMARFLLIALCALLIFTVIQPYLPNQKDPNEIFNTYDKYGKATPMKNKAPSAEYWFGTDNVGHDLWARIWAGTRTSLLLAFIVASVNCVVGITIGILWGYVRKLDALLTEVYNIMDNIPRTIILILMSYILRAGMGTMIISMCIVGWLGMARFIRNQVVMIRDRDYNLASRCLGTPTGKIMIRNLLPYLVSVIMLQTALAIPMVLSDEVFLTYCGLGMPKNKPSLGGLVEDGRKVMMSPTQRYQLVIPALVVTFITVSFYLIGNAFADASDPRNHV
ncbi:MAG: ABC transporter permease [Clostridia bacterium]|nr:ABC transporter permease [Clostridia bacterium]